MRLTKGNINHVTVIEKDGIPYSWFVAMRSLKVSDSRLYCNYRNGRSTDDEYKLEWLPKAVQAFVEDANREETRNDDWKGSNYIHYTYRRAES